MITTALLFREFTERAVEGELTHYYGCIGELKVNFSSVDLIKKRDSSDVWEALDIYTTKDVPIVPGDSIELDGIYWRVLGVELRLSDADGAYVWTVHARKIQFLEFKNNVIYNYCNPSLPAPNAPHTT